MNKITLIAPFVFGMGCLSWGQVAIPASPPLTGVEPVPAVTIRRQKTGASQSANSAFSQGLSGAGGYYSLQGSGAGTGVSGGIPPLITRFSSGNEELNLLLEEDLNVMTHLIERALKGGGIEDGPEEKANIPILFSEGRSVRALYLDGFGALFMIKVRFPVFAPSVAETKEPPPAADSEWDRAKKDLYSEADTRSEEINSITGGSRYDSEQVEQLKKVLLQTFKSASNVRNLKPNDFVAMTVFGRPATAVQTRKIYNRSGQPPQTTSRNNGASRKDNVAPETGIAEQKAETSVVSRPVDLPRAQSQGTVMAIRARKIDIDAFANDQIDFNTFQERVEQHNYSGNGYGITSINSWSKTRGGIAR